MVRYTLFLLVVLGSAATAIAAIAPAGKGVEPNRNVTIIQKNQAFPALGPLLVKECETEDCFEI